MHTVWKILKVLMTILLFPIAAIIMLFQKIKKKDSSE